MSEHPDAQDRLYVRGLLAEAGIEETPELVEALLALRSEVRSTAPEPTGKLGALLAGTPVPLARTSKRTRGIILSAALVGAMAAGATGVAANPDFLVRADFLPSVSFTPQDVPTLERSPQEPDPEADAAVADSEPADGASETAVQPEADEPAPVQVVPEQDMPAPAPVPVPVPVPAPVPAPAAVPAPAPAPTAVPDAPWPGPPGTGKGAVPGPQTHDVPGQHRRWDGGPRDPTGPGSGAADLRGRPAEPGNGRGNTFKGPGGTGTSHPGQGSSGWDR